MSVSPAPTQPMLRRRAARRGAWVGCASLALFVACWWGRPGAGGKKADNETTGAGSVAPFIADPAPALPPPAPSPSVGTNPTAAEPAGSPLAQELHAARFDEAHDLVVLRGLIAQFTTTLRLTERPPLGDNADLTAALTGRNRRHLVFIPPSHPAVRFGRLVDRRGRPYHFHARSAENIDVRSPGADGILFTPDDVISPPPIP